MSTEENNWPPTPREEGQETGGDRRESLTVASAPGEATPPMPAAAALPEDLRTPWSWGYLLIFTAFAFFSLIALEITFMIFGMVALRASPAELQKLATTSAPYVTARQALWFVVLMLYLYVMVRFFHGAPFWRTMGWKQLRSRNLPPRVAALFLVLGGAGLAVGVSIAARLVGTKSKLPIEELFRDRRGVLLVMTLALVAAPLVEETIFRGYIYPVIARSFGVAAGVVVTGVLFGLMHATQLWGAWGLVGLLIAVGIVLTYVRARTGTVLASYLLHLGYNAMLFLGSAVSTGGFRNLPPGS